jgi:hypothetical protein
MLKSTKVSLIVTSLYSGVLSILYLTKSHPFFYGYDHEQPSDVLTVASLIAIASSIIGLKAVLSSDDSESGEGRPAQPINYYTLQPREEI